MIGLSPVIIRTSMPAASAAVTAAFASARSGSIIPAIPTKARPRVSRHRVGGHRVQLVVGDQPGREGEHAQALLAHARVRGVELGAHVRDRDLRAAERAADVAAAVEDDIGTALDQLDHVLGAVDGDAVERGHELVGRVERDLGEPRVCPAGLLGVDAELRREHHERGLGRVADDGAVVAHRSVGVEGEPEREPGEVGDRRARD